MDNKTKISKILGVSAIIAITLITAVMATPDKETLCEKTCKEQKSFCEEICRDRQTINIQMCLAAGRTRSVCEEESRATKDSCIGACVQNKVACDGGCGAMIDPAKACEADCSKERTYRDEACRNTESICKSAAGCDKVCKSACKANKDACLENSKQNFVACKTVCGISKDCMHQCHEDRNVCDELARDTANACIDICKPGDLPCVVANCVDVKHTMQQACKAAEANCKLICTSCGVDADSDGELCDVSLGETAATCCRDCGCEVGNTNLCSLLSCDTSKVASGVCVFTQPAECSDAYECTKDVCNPTNGDCLHIPNPTGCPSGQICDPSQGCVSIAATCPGGCEDSTACTNDVCLVNGTCVHIPNIFSCPTGQYCNPTQGCLEIDFCGGKDCSDGIACTMDMCDPLGGCLHIENPAACPSGEYCDKLQGCISAATCPGGCDDGVACTDDSCNPTTGNCVHTPNIANCRWGQELCDKNDGCVPIKTCAGGCDDGVACTENVCNPGDGVCLYVPNDYRCAQGQICDKTQGCITGERSFPTDLCNKDCSDGIDCTVDVCDPTTGKCSHVENNLRCPTGEICRPLQGGCVAGQEAPGMGFLRSTWNAIRDTISNLFGR